MSLSGQRQAVPWPRLTPERCGTLRQPADSKGWCSSLWPACSSSCTGQAARWCSCSGWTPGPSGLACSLVWGPSWWRAAGILELVTGAGVTGHQDPELTALSRISSKIMILPLLYIYLYLITLPYLYQVSSVKKL